MNYSRALYNSVKLPLLAGKGEGEEKQYTNSPFSELVFSELSIFEQVSQQLTGQ